MIAAKKNNDTHNTNFNKYITQLHNIHISLSDPKPQSITKRITENQMFIEKMTIDGLDISELAIDDDIYTHISSAKAKYQDIYTRHQILESQISTNKSDSANIQTQINNNLQNMDILTSKVSAIDPNHLESLKSEKISLINQRQESQTTILNSSPVLSI